MWILGIILMIALYVPTLRGARCKGMIPLVRDPHCGFSHKCNSNGINKSNTNTMAIKYESCRKKELGVQDFIKVMRGMCPKGDKPPCPKMIKA
ncbi:accessory gland protein Acp63F-like [Drosophila bipectinata]|uniref:accessory gland protein Acp63F-like n=1 Tax=Drosophila bipectinata TaxID=42026 RepID=UPI0038B26A53